MGNVCFDLLTKYSRQVSFRKYFLQIKYALAKYIQKSWGVCRRVVSSDRLEVRCYVNWQVGRLVGL